MAAFRTKKITRLGLTTVAAIGLGVGAAASPVQAAQTAPARPAVAGPNCGWTPATNGSGSMRTDKPMKLRDGPSATCDTIGWTSMPTNQKLWARCKFVNDAGNTWYYVRPEPPAGEYWDPGWIFSGNVTGVPSGIPKC